jgi:uncharacterized repeat protein (TIGR01451 family)
MRNRLRIILHVSLPVLLVILPLYGWGTGDGRVRSALDPEQLAAQTVAEIIAEATRSNRDPLGRPLPLVTTWNGGTYPVAGMTPERQIQLIKEGHHLLPNFAIPSPTDVRLPYYAEAAMQEAARLKLPISMTGTQWEHLLSDAPYKTLDAPEGTLVGTSASASANPNVITLDGKVTATVDAFGPAGQAELWEEVGRKWGSSPVMQRLQQLYPEPSRIIMTSNNEHPRTRWYQLRDSLRYKEAYLDQGAENGLTDAQKISFRNRLISEGWIERYGNLLTGFRHSFSAPGWQMATTFTAYDAFGPPFFNRWSGWVEYSTSAAQTFGAPLPNDASIPRIEVWPLIWDGGSPSYYTNSWDGSADNKVWSPQLQFMNLVWMQEEAWKLNPEYWFEFSVWDGHSKTGSDKRDHYRRQGQEYSPERYGGWAQFGLWLNRPRAIREYRDHNDYEPLLPYYGALVDSVDRVYRNATLQRFWRNGTLVENPAHPHPWAASLAGFSDTDIRDRYGTGRWFLLSHSLEPAYPYADKYTAGMPVFPVALSLGEAPSRQWLLYLFSPEQDHRGVTVTIPGYQDVTVNATVGGSFYLLDEAGRTVTPVTENLAATFPAYDSTLTPPPAPALTLAGRGAGNIPGGTYRYRVTYNTVNGESVAGVESAPITITDSAQDGQVSVEVPVTTDPRVVSYNIYRSLPHSPDRFTRITRDTTVNNVTVKLVNGVYTDNSAPLPFNAPPPEPPGLQVTLTPDTLTPYLGNTLTFTVHYRNATGKNLTNAAVTVPIPDGTRYVAGSATSGGQQSAGSIIWKLESIPAGGQGILRYSVSLPP